MVFLDIDKSNYNLHQGANDNPIAKFKHYLHHSHVFLLVYMEGCGPCNAVRPEWQKIKNVLKQYKKSKEVAVVSLDRDLLDKINFLKHQPSAFPSMQYIHNKGHSAEDYEDSDINMKDRSIDSFVKWIQSKGIKSATSHSHRKTTTSHSHRKSKTKTQSRHTTYKIGGRRTKRHKR